MNMDVLSIVTGSTGALWHANAASVPLPPAEAGSDPAEPPTQDFVLG